MPVAGEVATCADVWEFSRPARPDDRRHYLEVTVDGLIDDLGRLDGLAEKGVCSTYTRKVLAMDETAIRAGRDRGKAKMHRAWLWPVYGDADEIAFTYSPNRGRAHVLDTLGGFSGTLLCDGWSAYEHYAAVNRAVIHAQCWSHARRYPPVSG